MKAVNVALALVVSLAIGLLVFEGGLRLLGFGPPPTLNDFDARLGWSKKPGVTVTRGTSEGHAVTFALNAYGLRDDPDLLPDKPAGVFRAVALGDSFTLGFTVAREDLFVDLLEGWWGDEGRRVQVVNTGTEGWSTDQEVAWLLEHGDEWQPDLVLCFAYENDVYWNGQASYVGNPKPRFAPDGALETGELEQPAAGGWLADTAIGRLLGAGRGEPPETFTPGSRRALREWGVLLEERPAFMDDAVARTRGALRALKTKADELGAAAVVVPIPSHSAVDPDYRPTFEQKAGLAGVAWSPDRPVDLFLALAADAGLASLDPRPFLRGRREAGEKLYFDTDWHLNPTGNRAFAEFLHAELDRLGLVPGATTPVAAAAALALAGPAGGGGLPGWLPWFLGLWAVLGTSYATVYRRVEKPLPALLKVGALLAVIFLIAVGGTQALGTIDPRIARVVLVLVVLAILGFVLYKLGNRLGTIAELLGAFIGRGHWYLMPLVTVLLTVGSLLVVAASSPLVAPFIYTLF